jgi:uncharacterized protein (DUF58 family)
VSIFANKRSNVEPSRDLSSEKIFEDGTVKAELRITNKGFKTGFLEVRDTVPQEMELKRGSNYTYLNLKPRASTYLRYTVKCPIKGVYKLGPVSLRSHDPFNMFYRETKIDYDSVLTVFPQTRDIKELYIRSKQPKMYPGEMKVKMPGPGAEFFSIRDYTPSDAFKDINWKAYAKKRKLLVNERERLSVSDITIVYDARAASRYGIQSDNANLYGARAAATLANFFLARRDSVQLVIYGDKVLTIKKGTGKKQLYEILTALAHASPKGDIPLSGIVEVAIPYMPRRSPVIIISSLDDDDSIRKAVSTMCVLEFDVTIITPSSIDFELMVKSRQREAEKGKLLRGKRRFETAEENIAYDVLRLERDILISELRGYGIRVVEWDPKVPLHQILLEARNI